MCLGSGGKSRRGHIYCFLTKLKCLCHGDILHRNQNVEDRFGGRNCVYNVIWLDIPVLDGNGWYLFCIIINIVFSVFGWGRRDGCEDSGCLVRDSNVVTPAPVWILSTSIDDEVVWASLERRRREKETGKDVTEQGAGKESLPELQGWWQPKRQIAMAWQCLYPFLSHPQSLPGGGQSKRRLGKLTLWKL